MEAMMEHAMLVVVAVVGLLLLHHQQVAAEGSSNSSDIVHGMLAQDASHLQIMRLVQAHHARRFSYCLCADPGHLQGVLRLDGEVPGTSGMARSELLYNTHHGADYGHYFVDLVGVSLNGAMLPGIGAGTFHRNFVHGTGGTVLDAATPLLIMVLDAYNALEHAVAAHLGELTREHREGYTFCFRRLPHHSLPTAKLHLMEPGAEVTLPPSKLFMTDGQVTCLAVLPGPMTFIGGLPQVDTRFTFHLDDNAVFLRQENCEHDR